MHAVIASRLDYSNSLFMNICKDHLLKLQKLQNSAARLILERRRYESASEAIRELHWLNVEQRITFKTILIVYKAVRGLCSDNINLKFVDGRRGNSLMLETPNAKTKHGKRIFAYNGSRLWNAIPIEIKLIEDIDIFKQRLKTLLFKNFEKLKLKAFPS